MGVSSHLGKLTNIQKKSIWIINIRPYNYHTEPLSKEFSILRVNDLYKYNVQIWMHKLTNGKLTGSLNNLFYFENSERPVTMQLDLANPSKFRTKISSLLPLHMFPKILKELNVNFHNLPTLNMFKHSIRDNYLKSYLISVTCKNERCNQCFPAWRCITLKF